MTAVPCQKPGFPESHGLTEEDCRNSMWAITPDGRRRRAAEAMNVALSAATKSLLPMMVYSVPLIGRIQELAYFWIARNRRRFPGGLVHCEEHPGECGEE